MVTMERTHEWDANFESHCRTTQTLTQTHIHTQTHYNFVLVPIIPASVRHSPTAGALRKRRRMVPEVMKVVEEKVMKSIRPSAEEKKNTDGGNERSESPKRKRAFVLWTLLSEREREGYSPSPSCLGRLHTGRASIWQREREQQHCHCVETHYNVCDCREACC